MLKEYRFSEARKEFTHLFDDVQNSVPSLIKARKQSEQDGVFINKLILAEFLEHYKFHIEKFENEGTHSIWIKPIEEYAIGETEEECKKEAAKAVQSFAEDFINDPYMFKAKNMRPLIPYASRILLCDDLDDIEQILFEEEYAEV